MGVAVVVPEIMVPLDPINQETVLVVAEYKHLPHLEILQALIVIQMELMVAEPHQHLVDSGLVVAVELLQHHTTVLLVQVVLVVVLKVLVHLVPEISQSVP